MKRTLNKILAALLALVLCVGLFAAGATPASAAEATGTCGKNLTWSLENGVLTISGTGAMNDYNTLFLPPWNLYSHLVQRIVVHDGITSIGDRAFYGMSNLVTVTLPASVTRLGEMAFFECTSLKQISIPGVETIGWGCFYGCISLNNVTLPECLRSIGGQAFYQCAKLSGITIPKNVEEMGVMVFSYCKSLVYVKIQARLTVLPNWTFYGCVLLWEVYLPSSITVVETNALGECPNLYYVDYGGTEEVKEEIEHQLSQPTTMVPDEDAPSDVTYNESENATITITQGGSSNTSSENTSGTTVDATVSNPDGWQEVIEEVNTLVATGQQPDVNVQIQSNLTVGEGTLTDLSGKNVTVTVETSDNVSWQIVVQDQTKDSIAGSQDFSVSINQNTLEAYRDVLKGVPSYTLTMGYTSLYTTVRFPVGIDAARQVATLYWVNQGKLEKLASVLVDDEGMAAYSLAGTKAGQYIVALNVPGIDRNEVIIPQSLMGEYGINPGDTLMDASGTKYIVTGMVNELGFGMGTMTIIIVSVLVGSAVVVGVVMTIWQKQRKKAMAGIYADVPEKMPGRAEKTSDRKEKSSEKKDAAAKKKPEEKKKAAPAEEEEEETASDTKDSFAALAERVRRKKTENSGEKRPVSKEKKK